MARGSTRWKAWASSHGMDRRARRGRLLASTAILWAVFLPQASLATDECGPAPSAVCDSGDAVTGYPNFPNGVIYYPIADLTLVVDSGAAIAPGSGIRGIVISDGDNIDVALENGSSITTSGNYAWGMFVDSAASVDIKSAASITTLPWGPTERNSPPRQRCGLHIKARGCAP
jgi:hypothetical protein